MTKIHLRTDCAEKLIAVVLTPGRRREATQVQALLERGAVARPGGLARVLPDRVAGDKGYTGKRIRRYVRRRGIGVGIGIHAPWNVERTQRAGIERPWRRIFFFCKSAVLREGNDRGRVGPGPVRCERSPTA